MLKDWENLKHYYYSQFYVNFILNILARLSPWPHVRIIALVCNRYTIIMLTYLIWLSVVDSIDESGKPKEVRISWPCCFVKAEGEVETQAEDEFSSAQPVAIEIIGISCKLNKILTITWLAQSLHDIMASHSRLLATYLYSIRCFCGYYHFADFPGMHANLITC